MIYSLMLEEGETTLGMRVSLYSLSLSSDNCMGPSSGCAMKH